MSRAASSRGASRDEVVSDLFDALACLMNGYRGLPEAERVQRLSAEAERITGTIALLLSTARAQLPPRM